MIHIKNRIICLCFLCLLGSLSPLYCKTADNLCPELDLLMQTGQPLITVFKLQFEKTITHISPGWFDFEESGNAPTMFSILINPGLRNAAAANRLRLGVYITADTALDQEGAGEFVVLDRLYYLSEEHIGVMLTSNEVLDLPRDNSGGVSGSSSELLDLFAREGQIPSVNLDFKFGLTCDQATYAQWAATRITLTDQIDSIQGELRHVNVPQALSPGADIRSANPQELSVSTPPSFHIFSELLVPEINYVGEPKLTLEIYELIEGEWPVNAVNGVPYYSFPIYGHEGFFIPYPPEAPPLTPGRTYVWQVIAHLRGPTTTDLVSNALYFRVSDDQIAGLEELTGQKTIEGLILYADDYNRRLFAALKIILRENYDLFIAGLKDNQPIKGHIRWNGQPFTLDQIEALAKKFHQEKCTLTRVRFQ
jgi:hypothetical protein